MDEEDDQVKLHETDTRPVPAGEPVIDCLCGDRFATTEDMALHLWMAHGHEVPPVPAGEPKGSPNVANVGGFVPAGDERAFVCDDCGNETNNPECRSCGGHLSVAVETLDALRAALAGEEADRG